MTDEKIEYIDIVDENDNIIRKKVSRQEALENDLCSRIAIVMLIDQNSKEMVIQRRSPNSWFKPNAYCSSVCGYVLSGETMEQGAYRETKEEMGIEPELLFLDKVLFIDQEKHEVTPKPFIMGVYYALVNKADIQADPNEVSSYDFYSLERAKDLLSEPVEMLHTMFKPSLEIIEKSWSKIIF